MVNRLTWPCPSAWQVHGVQERSHAELPYLEYYWWRVGPLIHGYAGKEKRWTNKGQKRAFRNHQIETFKTQPMCAIVQQSLFCSVPKQNGLYGGGFDHATFEIPSWWLWLRRSAAGTSVWAQQEWLGGGQNFKNAPPKTRGVNVLVFDSFVKWTNDPRSCTIMFLWD